jgi:hypothetical protein
MICTTKIQAERVAKAGAAKMDALGYDYKRSAHVGYILYVTNPEGARYRVSLNPQGANCSCKFFDENRAHGVCKHIEWGREKLAFETWVDEQEALLVDGDLARFDHVDDWQDVPGSPGRDRSETPIPSASAWPSCPLHGPFYAATNGQPMSTCDRCEEYR